MMTVTLPGSKSVMVRTLLDASDVVVGNIRETGVGSNEWSGTGAGRIFVDGKQVAHVSYNGRVWEGVEDGKLGHKRLV